MQGYKPTVDLGKWTKTAPLFDSLPHLAQRQQKPETATTTNPFQSITPQAASSPLKFSFLTPKPNAKPELSVLEDARRQASGASIPHTNEEPELYPYADILKSNRSAKAIEDELYDGIAGKPVSPKPPSPALDEIFSKVRLKPAGNGYAQSSVLRQGSYSEAAQRFQISESSLLSLMNDGPVKDEPTVSSTPQFRFMGSRRTPNSVEFKLKKESEPDATNQHPDLIASLPAGIKRIDTTAWQSSSREKWAYDIDVQAEAKAEAERILANDPRAGMTPEQLEAERLEEEERKKDIERLVEKAKSMKFRVGYKDLGVWKGEYERSSYEPVEEISVQKRVFIPKSISVANLSNSLKIPLGCVPSLYFVY